MPNSKYLYHKLITLSDDELDQIIMDDEEFDIEPVRIALQILRERHPEQFPTPEVDFWKEFRFRCRLADCRIKAILAKFKT